MVRQCVHRFSHTYTQTSFIRSQRWLLIYSHCTEAGVQGNANIRSFVCSTNNIRMPQMGIYFELQRQTGNDDKPKAPSSGMYTLLCAAHTHRADHLAFQRKGNAIGNTATVTTGICRHSLHGDDIVKLVCKTKWKRPHEHNNIMHMNLSSGHPDNI